MYENKIIMSKYAVPQSLFMTLKRMTLNSHFAINTVFQVESFSMDALVLRHDSLKIDKDVHILSVAKM